jgi:hypothetical protein
LYQVRDNLSPDEHDVVEAISTLGIVASSLGRRRHLFFECQAPLTRIQIRELHHLTHRSRCIVDFYETGLAGKGEGYVEAGMKPLEKQGGSRYTEKGGPSSVDMERVRECL